MIGRIYKIIHSQSKICYVGSTFNTLNIRWTYHKGPNNNCCISKYFKLYGIDQFKIILIKEYEVCDRKQLEAYEQLWISKLSTIEQFNTLCIKKQLKKQYYESNKEHLSEKGKIYRLANKERISEQKKQYREVNKERLKERMKNWYESNKDKIKEQSKIYYESNKERLNEQKKQYREVNKERLKEQKKQYREANKSKISEQKKQKYTCECGLELNRSSKARHEKTLKHQDWVSQA